MISIIIAIVAAILFVVFLVLWAMQHKSAASIAAERDAAVQNEMRERAGREAAEEHVRTLIEQNAAARERLAATEERMENERAEREKAEEMMRTQFRNLANDILAEQSQHFKETNKESLDQLLKPFKENISEFRDRVERIYASENEQQGALRNELRNLMELNRRITTETTNLTNALKGNSKVQGDWGEMILETILDGSNLIKGVHYDTQVNLKDEAGNNLRPP